jgi:putative heme-binding domain-containing protein
LDKSPKIVEYQLKRLSNADLLRIETATDHPKYAPVFAAILSRPGMALQDRQTALDGLAKIRQSSPLQEAQDALAAISGNDPQSWRVAKEITDLLLARSPEGPAVEQFARMATSDSQVVRRAGMAGLVAGGRLEQARALSEVQVSFKQDLLAAALLVPQPALRRAMETLVLSSLQPDQDPRVRQQAVQALPAIPGDLVEYFQALVPLLAEDELRQSVVESMLRLTRGFAASQQSLPQATAAVVANDLVDRAEKVDAAQRTAEPFLQIAQLVDAVLPAIDRDSAKRLRTRMDAIAVRVVRIGTVEEELRYDIKYFAAQKGKPVQILLDNRDLMPHNLVITVPGALKEIALLAATMPPEAPSGGKQYVPASEKVLFATNMVQAAKQERLTFDAPATPGEYPFVCTFPNHWLRMYGVMVVVDDLDAFLQSPREPVDPIGNQRSFVKNWKLADFPAEELAMGLRGRSETQGAKIFKEATCGQCHQMRAEGGKVGPDLTDVLQRWKGDMHAVLREILEPSHKIDAKYANHSILTESGQVFSGVMVAEDKDNVWLVSSPDQPQPTRIPRDEIQSMVPSSKSLMPAAIMDQFTKDEILELLSYVAPKPFN